MTDVDHAAFTGGPLSIATLEYGARRRGKPGYYDVAGKRILDLLFVAALAPILLPLVVVLAVLLAFDGHSPFFGHARISRNGKTFRCWKFRTMVPNAGQKLEQILASDPDAAQEWAQTQKLSNDPRVTRIGRFLRTTSLDELPQFWNILVGEMSVVGPRPITREELPRYGAAAATVFSHRPGLTGLWQVSGRSRVGYEERVSMDLQYSKSASLLADLAIMMKTAKVVLERTGT